MKKKKTLMTEVASTTQQSIIKRALDDIRNEYKSQIGHPGNQMTKDMLESTLHDNSNQGKFLLQA